MNESINDGKFEDIIDFGYSGSNNLFYIFNPSEDVNITQIENAIPVYNVDGQFNLLQYIKKINPSKAVIIEGNFKHQQFKITY